MAAVQMTRDEFIAAIAPYAVADMRNSGVLASITLAQAALESAWGRSAPGNNLFGIKGAGQTQTTKEFVSGQWITIQDGFRVYESWEGSIRDHSRFLTENSRYARAGFFECCKRLDYAGAANALQKAGYATDPTYAQKLTGIIEANGFSKLDKEAAEPMLDKGVANTVIETWIGPAWKKANEAGNEDEKKYMNWLANELRKASGQPLQ
ncbi:glycoside hydrolase family 73 protein [Paenibacillus elgii]|uniref:glycoside hydrolase family 73 protein n=1 Tax=Paenibacillus elgii TaxID=189691 RepID=UPI000248CEF6|nr:glucosaminidase domain-containing protein [Paenibacillus elgii]